MAAAKEDWIALLKELRAAPNLLTFLRLCLIPFIVIAVLEAHYPPRSACSSLRV